MTCKTLTLSTMNTKYIPFEIYTDKEFRLISGNSVMTILSIQADILSPLISKYHQRDPTMDTIFLSKDERSSNLLSDDIQTILHKIIKSEKVDINYDESIKLRIISSLLENYEIYESIEKIYPICDKDLDYPIDYLLNFLQYKFNTYQFKFEDNDCIQFIAENFYKYEKIKLFKLPKIVLFHVISSDKLTIKNEDELFEFITELFQSNNHKFDTDEENKIDITSFYELIDFNYLNDDNLLHLIHDIKVDQISSQLWQQIKTIFSQRLNRINQTNNPIHKCIDKVHRVYCPFNGDGKNRFNGIIKYLTDKFGGNIVEKGVIKIENLCKCDFIWNREDQSGDVRAAVRLNDPNKYFDSYITPDQNDILYLKYDFLGRKVQLNCYSIRSRPNCGKEGANFMNWIIEGTNDDSDDKNWVRLDTRNNDYTTDEKSAVNTFYISNKLKENEYFRFIRVGCIKNSCGNNAIVFSALEFFGSILDD